MKNQSRKEFLKQSAMAGAALLLSSLEAVATSENKKIRIGIIGCGSVSGQYLPHLSKSSHIELVSVCDIVLERAKNRAKEFTIPHVYEHIYQQLGGAPFDLLVNLTDMQEHGRLNKMALASGKHVWSEKPMANT
jgi:predicted dehydrogenase